jgi:hypothetical protein
MGIRVAILPIAFTTTLLLADNLSGFGVVGLAEETREMFLGRSCAIGKPDVVTVGDFTSASH